MFYSNTLNLIQVGGGTQVKQGDLGSRFSYKLANEKEQELDNFDEEVAHINLVLDDKIVFTTTATVDNSTVTFNIDKAIPVGLYFLEIKIRDYIFPSDKQTIIFVQSGAVAYDLKELVPNYDTNMTIAGILSDLSQKGIDIKDLKTKMNAIYDNALADHAEVAQARGVFKTLSNRLNNFDAEIQNVISGSPKGVYANLSELQSAKPNGDSGIYVTTDNGHWYYYNDGWKDGGTYQSAGVNREVESILSNTMALNIPVNQNAELVKTVDINLKKGEALSISISSESIAANSQVILGYNSLVGEFVANAAYFKTNNKEVFYAPEDVKSLKFYISGGSITTNGTALISLYKESIIDVFSEKLDNTREVDNYAGVRQGQQLLIEFLAILPKGTEIEIWSKNYSELLSGEGNVGIKDELGQQINSVSALTNQPKTLVLDRNIKKLVFYVSPERIAKSGMLNICYRVIGKDELLERELKKLSNPPRNYHGKSIGIIGDSYSTFKNWMPAGNAVYYTGENNTKTGVTSVDKTWWHLLTTRLEASLLRNDSWSGATIAGTGYSGQDATSYSFVTRGNRSFGESKILEQKPDVIFILGGLNDTWANSPVGDVKYSNFTESDLKQTLPSTSKLISDLKNYNPGCQIVLIAPHQVKSEIKTGMRTICEHYKATFVDLPQVATVNDHPTDRGMQQIADYIYDKITNL